MSIEFSIRIPIDLLPAPAVFIEELGPNWIELYEDEPDVHPLATMNQSVFPICPNLEEYGPDKWLYDRSYMFYLLNVSTRGLEVWYSDDAFHVKVLTLSHPAE